MPLATCAQNSTSAARPTTNAPSRHASQERRKRVAVLDFDYAKVKTATGALFGTGVDVGKGVSDLLARNLVTDGTYSVIERKQLDKILAEQKFSNSDRSNPASAAKLGKLLGIDAIIVGSVSEFGNETKTRNIGGGAFGHKDTKANVVLDSRIVDIDTAEILAVVEGKGRSMRSSTSLLGEGAKRHGSSGGAADFISSAFQKTNIGEATKAAVDQITTGLIADAPKVPSRPLDIEGLVAAIDGHQIVLNMGARTGIKVGDHISVERVTSTVKDPTTGAIVHKMITKLGELVVVDVDDVAAVCEIVSGSGFKVGDIARTAVQ